MKLELDILNRSTNTDCSPTWPRPKHIYHVANIFIREVFSWCFIAYFQTNESMGTFNLLATFFSKETSKVPSSSITVIALFLDLIVICHKSIGNLEPMIQVIIFGILEWFPICFLGGEARRQLGGKARRQLGDLKYWLKFLLVPGKTLCYIE